jgi:hypothetical protein
MDHRGAGRARPTADTGRQPRWPSADGAAYPDTPAGTGPQRVSGPGTGPQRVTGPGTGPQRVTGPGTGPQRLSGSGTGPQRVSGPGTGPQRITGPQRVSGPGTGPQRITGAGTGPQRVAGPGTGPQRLTGPGSGAQPVLAAGSGAYPVLGPTTDPHRLIGPGTGGNRVLDGSGAPGRTPSQGFPAARDQAEPPAGPWHTPTGPRTVPDGTDGTGFPGPPADAIGEAAPPRRRRGGPTRRHMRSRVAWLATAVVVAAGAGFAAYKYLYEPRVNAPVPPTLRLPTNAPGSPGFDKTLGKWQHIGTRSKDPQSLTIAALYPPQFSLNGQSYVRTAASVTKTCTLAVFGADLQAALQSGHCSQVVRASYLSGDGTMMGTIGVVNLISSNAAQKAGQATGPKEIIAPLTGKKGPTKKLGTGTGVVQAEIKGHYLILMWAEFTNLKSPASQAQRQALEQFAANLVTGSANIDLSTRMLTGKP